MTSKRPAPPGVSTRPSAPRPSLNRGSRPSPAEDPWQEYVARIAEAPESGTVRGLYFTEILRLAPDAMNAERRRFIPFSKYPLREFMRLLVDAGQLAHEGRDPADALQRLGRTTYTTFAASMAGMTLLAGLSVDIVRLLDLLPKIYPLTMDPGSARVLWRGEAEAVVHLRDLWTFPEAYQVGVWLGALEALDLIGTMDVIRHSWSSVDFHVRWQRR